MTLALTDTVERYSDKSADYFEGVSPAMLARLPHAPQGRVLEVGCGSGAMGVAVLGAGKAGVYVGVELSPAAAEVARARLSAVHVGDVEKMDLAVLGADFDALLISEVLEHLVDPWTTLRRLVERVRPGGLIMCSSPNVAGKTVLRQLLKGRFDYTESGVMDRTHLRWFTPATYGDLLVQAGCDQVEAGPLGPLGAKSRLFDKLTGSRFNHLLYNQILAVGRRAQAKASFAPEPDVVASKA